MDEYSNAVKDLMRIPGVGKSIADDLWNIGIRRVGDLEGRSPDELYKQSNEYAGAIQDRCVLYVFRCAVYFASENVYDHEKLKWWNWKDIKKAG